MDVERIIAELDAEIASLQQARAVLAGHKRPATTARRKKRHLTPEGRARIAAAARKRWAAQKKTKG